MLAWLQVRAAYDRGIAACGGLSCLASSARTLRAGRAGSSDISAYIIRAAFWIVLLVGIADAVISFLRVEELARSGGRRGDDARSSAATGSAGPTSTCR